MLTLTKLSFSSSGFSWVLTSDGRDVLQTAYHLQLALCADFRELLWDSGVQESRCSVFAPYEGAALPTCETLFWRVRVWDNRGDDSGWIEAAPLLTGPGEGDWKASFITPDTEDDAALSKGKLLRKEFAVGGNIRSAVAHVSALGLYELYFNGARAGDALLSPGWTEYDSHLLVETIDVTHLLRQGQNAVGAMLGAGWYKGDLAGWIGRRCVYGNRTALILQLDIRYESGQRQLVVSDESWTWSDGPIRYAELYHGEAYDARLERRGWSEPGFGEGWDPVGVLDRGYGTLRRREAPPVRRQGLLSVRQVITTPKGETVLEFGQNLAGWVRFSVRGKAGERVVLRHAEILDGDGNVYLENMRSARSEIVYTLRGGGEETFEPHFTFQGFRYVRVDEYPGPVDSFDFQAVVVHSDLERTGTFSCSNGMLNRLHENILWGLKGNFVDIPSDCPQRDERLGWTGDAQVFIRTAAYLMDVRQFFGKWLRDLRYAQFENGGVPFVVPDVLTGKFTEDDVIANAESVSGWGDAAAICPWTLWTAYGDRALLAECYPSMKAWVEYIRARAAGGLLWNGDYQLGDWVALDAKEGSYFGATATDLIATAYYAKSAELVSKAAAVLGLHEDAENYRTLRDEIGKAYAAEFFTATGRLASNTQTAHILSLHFGLTPERFRARTVAGLLRLLDENGGHLTTGFLGTPYFCRTLADHGCLDEAYALLLREDYPSWLYQITKGATTVWEHWDGIKPDGSLWSPNMNSFNHYAYGSVGEFLYSVIGGLDTSESEPGYRKLLIRPRPGGGLSFAEVSLHTPYGRVSVCWSISGGVFKLTAEVPHNVRAAVTLPDGSEHEVGSGKHAFSCNFSQG